MLFNTPQFAVFFLLVYAAFRLAGPRRRASVLLAASLAFYTLWHPVYLLLLLGDLLVNFALLHAVARSAHKRLYLGLSIAFTLGLLAFFKYAAMIVETLSPVVGTLSGWQPPMPDLFLPLGISFYSFQIIAFAVDTYRTPNAPLPSLGRYLLFVSFFPQLIAGPILRSSELLPQLERGGRPTPARNRRGLWLIASGLAKKVVLADFLLAPFVNDVFDGPGLANGAFHLVAAYSFAFQIYFDFSGYVDIARGLALLFGFELPMNFAEPYLSRNPAEFWRRWHMTLSRWLRDYLYIPLGGNRRGDARTCANLIVTMLLGGLWHGAAWTFVAWGALHGALLVAHRRFGRRGCDETAPLVGSDLPRIIATFHAVVLAWVFFRAASFADAWVFLHSLLTGSYTSGWPLMQLAVVATCALLHPLERMVRSGLPRTQARAALRWWAPAVEGCALGVVVGAAIALSGVGREFLYFQF